MATNIRAWVEPRLFDKAGKRIKYPENQIFRIRYRDKGGIQNTAESITGSRNAEGLQKKVQKDLDNERLGIVDGDLRPEDIFQRFLRAYSSDVSERWLIQIEEEIRYFLKRPKIRTMSAVTHEAIEDYKFDMKQGLGFKKPLAKGTIYRRLASLKIFLKWCKREKIIGYDPFENITNPQPASTATFLEDQELSNLEKVSDFRFLPLFRLGWMAGLREGEIFVLKWEWIKYNEDGSAFLYLPREMTKTENPRVVPLKKEIMNVLGSRRTGDIFPGWDYIKVKYWWTKAKKAAAITRKCTFYATRHTFCKKYMEEGGQETALAEILGHSDLKMIHEVYGHFTAKHLMATISGITNGVTLRDEPVIGVLSPAKEPIDGDSARGTFGVNL